MMSSREFARRSNKQFTKYINLNGRIRHFPIAFLTSDGKVGYKALYFATMCTAVWEPGIPEVCVLKKLKVPDGILYDIRYEVYPFDR